ncbi:MAG: thermostable hemolysin [Gammaproteobacteria bacterium]|nr:thermostable hemolysin [Pseudomonadales bacterium]MCP5345740.1 thermostable hemolysin [Pseudomonadales bacterium]
MTTSAIELQQLVKHPTGKPAISVTSASKSAATHFTLNSPDSERRTRLEQFIADKFNAIYGAAIVEFFPLLLSRSDDEQLSSVVGLRPGTERPLFLEQYLDSSLEQAIAQQSGLDVGRERLMEIGNLASSYRSGNQFMFMLLTAVLSRAGYDWVVFTATAQVRALLARLDFHPLTLCDAREAKLVNKKQVWGSYYQSQPMVQAGSIAEGMAILHRNHFARTLLSNHEAEIETLARELISLRSGQQIR